MQTTLLLFVCTVGALAADPSIESTEEGGMDINIAEGGDLSIVQEGVKRSLRDVPVVQQSTTDVLSEVAKSLREIQGAGTNIVVAITTSCPGNDGACNSAQAGKDGKVKAFLRGTTGFTGAGIYTCQYDYSDATLAYLDKNCGRLCQNYRITTFTATSSSTSLSDLTTVVECDMPHIPSAKLPAADWTMTVQIHEGGTKLAGYDGPVRFQTSGPVMSGLPDTYNVHVTDLIMTDGAISPIVVRFSVTDVDSDLAAITATAAILDPAVVPNENIVIGGNGQGDFTLQMTLPSNGGKLSVPCPDAKPDCTNVITEVIVTAKDDHDRSSSKTMRLNLDLFREELAFVLDTGDNTDRHYDDPFWVDDAVVGTDYFGVADTYDILETPGDVKTSAFGKSYIGHWVRLEYYDEDFGQPTAKVYYEVKKSMREKTLKELFEDETYNNAVLTGLRAKIENNGPGIDDPFFDHTSPLKINIQPKGFNNGNTMIRLGTTQGNIYGNDHSYSGMGIVHEQNSWCFDTEAAPNDGYCHASDITYSRKKDGGPDQSFAASNARFGGCKNIPTMSGGCVGEYRAPRIAMYISVDEPDM